VYDDESLKKKVPGFHFFRSLFIWKYYFFFCISTSLEKHTCQLESLPITYFRGGICVALSYVGFNKTKKRIQVNLNKQGGIKQWRN